MCSFLLSHQAANTVHRLDFYHHYVLTAKEDKSGVKLHLVCHISMQV